MEEILVTIIQFIIEGLGQAILEIGFEWAIDTSGEKTSTRIFLILGAIFLGCIVGAATLLIFPVSLIHYSWLRCLNLIFAPFLAYQISRISFRLREKSATRGQLIFSVIFTFALVVIRLAYAGK